MYTDKPSIQNYTLTNIDNSFDSQLNEWIAAMSRYIDDYCGETILATAPTTRLYDGTGEQTLKIDGAYSISAVTVSDVTVTPYFYPANNPRKYLLDLDRDTFAVGKQNVSVTGIFGRFTTLPADIKYACTVLVAGIVNHSNKQTDGIKSEKVGEYQVTYKDEKERADYDRAMKILDAHRKVVF